MVHTDVFGLLTDKHGGYTLIGQPQATSRYQGFYIRTQNQEMFRIIESLYIPLPLLEISTELNTIIRTYTGVTEEVSYVPGQSSLLQRFSSPTTVHVMLDGKKIDDHCVWGRDYAINNDDDIITIHFQKKYDTREHTEFGEYEWYLAIIAMPHHVLQANTWVEHAYTYDKNRKSPPENRYVYHALTIKSKEIVYAVGATATKAQQNAKIAWKNRVKKATPNSSLPILVQGDLKNAYAAACHALASLITPDGIMAGLPWFYQIWTRDAAITLPALSIIKEEQIARTTALELIRSIRDNSLLPCRIKPASSEDCFDAVGWSFFGIETLLSTNPKLFSDDDKNIILSTLRSVISTIKKTMLQDSLVYTPPRMTWMDTVWEHDAREGCRIEHQALLLAMLRLQRTISRRVDPFEKELAAKTRYAFFKNGYIFDGSNDPIIRPNLFLAYYVYPELLSVANWKICIDTTLPKLWLAWGGISSIDTTHPLFVGLSTGENPQSYHRGDSWYWINNITALCLHRLDKTRYNHYITAITAASTRDILEMGALGHHSEISDALTQQSSGCVSQAWSNATYIQLIYDLYVLGNP
ncbi:MAG: amylo-alpha-1,6-glucosidase [Nanoarchaeota archaeon]